MERHHNAGHKNTRVICWLISLLVLVASPTLVQAATITCAGCHGGSGTVGVKDSPTGTRDPATGVFKGSHGTHLPGTQNATQCTVCHGAAAASYTNSHSATNKNQIQMAAKLDSYSGLKRARYGKGLFWNMTSVPQYIAPASTCSNVNCHFERVTDTWGSAAYTTGDVATCSKCHDALLTSGAHTKHITAYGGALASCVQCHADYTTAAGSMKFQHATSAGRVITVKTAYVGSNNKYLPGPASTGRTFGTCSSTYCHSSGQSLTSGTVATPAYVTVSFGTTGTTCASAICHPTSRAATASGSHTKHLADANVKCADCHTGVSTDGLTYAFGGTHINNSIDVAASVGYTAPNGNAGNGYFGCNTASCHNNGTTDASQPATPNWGQTAVACTVCHAASPTTGTHTKHMTTTNKAIACGDCHAGSSAGSTGGPGHLNNVIDVIGVAPIAKHASGTYTTTCATTYCHSSGQSLTNGTSATPVYYTGTRWGTPATGACGTCHPATLALTISGSHAKHLTSTVKTIGCNDCHANVSSNGTSYSTTTHVDGQIDVIAAQSYDKAGAPGNGYGTCATGACHNDGTTATGRTVQWGNTQVACAACHAAIPTTGAHTKHFSLNAAKFTIAVTCASCHSGANATTGGPGHFNNTIEVIGLSTSPVAKHAVGTYSGTCSVSCHADGAGQNVATGWGVASTGCDFCHPMANLGGAHQKHAGRINLASTTRTYANYTANVSDGIDGAGGSYGFGCTTCHPSAVSNHINGFVEVTFVADAAAGTMRTKIASSAATYSLTANLQGDKSCANTYCHSNGIGTVANTTITWTSTFSGDRCAKCHGNLPTTGAHGAHKVGIHYDNIFSGVSGFLGYSSSGNKAHGVSTQATTISCNLCHAATVNTAYNKNATACTSCHSADAGVALLDATNGFKFHVNGKVDVAFPNTNMRSKAQIRDTSFSVYSGLWARPGGYKAGAGSYDIAKKSLNTSVFTASGTQGQGSCANVVCHNQRTGDSVTWNQTLQCVDCHSQL